MSANLRTERPYLSAAQITILRELNEKYGLNPLDITFLDNGEPWLTSSMRMEIARRSEEFQSVEEGFHTFIPSLNQVVHSAEVVNKEGQRFRRSGVAAIGEKLHNEEIADEHELAASRALGAALEAAGFNPLRRARGQRSEGQHSITMVEDAAEKPTESVETDSLAGQSGRADSESGRHW